MHGSLMRVLTHHSRTRGRTATWLLIALWGMSTYAFAAPPARNSSHQLIGHVDGVRNDGSNHFSLVGWVCVKGTVWPMDVHVYVNGPAGEPLARHVATSTASAPAEDAVTRTCGNQGFRFSVPIGDHILTNYNRKRIYVHGIHPTGGTNRLLEGSGLYLVPDPVVLPADSVVTYIHVDRLGSTVMTTDENATVLSSTRYEPYGASERSDKEEAPGYTGHYEDPLTGMTYMQARYYDAEFGRFMSADPMLPTSGNIFNFNRYQYANNNPIMFLDPTGAVVQACGGTVSFPDGNGGTGVSYQTVDCGGGGGGSSLWWSSGPPSGTCGNPWGGFYPGGGGGTRPGQLTPLALRTSDMPTALDGPLNWATTSSDYDYLTITSPLMKPPKGHLFKKPLYKKVIQRLDDFASNQLVGKLTFGFGKIGKFGRATVNPFGLLINVLTIEPLGGCDEDGRCADEVHPEYKK